MATKTAVTSRAKPYDGSKYLRGEDTIRHYLNNALESGDARLIQTALGTIAKARGMTSLARDSGIKREALYRALSDTGNPEFGTILAVVHALGMRIRLESAEHELEQI
ncbi:addiction module antidote protein [Paraburkholderia megapolitana]|uniref:Probable addiction module antidote protein n=1 Tax=Paraburkholderia megapolitana TaxID=420953 RepID=A0A1I3IKT3_9BURK|nr:addiction module antidote protein [Paraburkholderia megapolitana]QDQ85146.1 putative addiction module antidote protein [Paraburkholderia megapolitana]SFI48608.1 probable addiction module antidote protein [Paraburkholderia megapolitana]